MKIILSLAFLCLSLTVFSQKKLNFLSSADLLQEGIELHEKENYYEAIQKFQKVSINDTNYALAQYEMALSYFGMEQYGHVQKVLQDLLDFDLRFDFKHKVYSLLGSAYDNNSQPEKAIEVYTEAIALFPKQHTLYFNRGITYNGMKQYDKGLADFKKAVECNVYHANSHLQLGIMAANEGQHAQAMLSLMTFLLLEPGDSRAPKVVGLIENIADGSYEAEPKNIVISPEQERYDDINLYIKNKIALQNDYKAKLLVQTAYGRQLHLFLKEMSYDKENRDFWNQNYMAFYTAVFKEKKLDALNTYSLKSVDSEGIQQKVRSQAKKLDAFIEWATPAFREQNSHKYMEFEGKEQYVTVEYTPSHFNGYGKTREDGKPIGTFYYFHPNGSRELIAHFDNEGRPDGDWEVYNMYNGKISRKINFKNTDSGQEKSVEEFYFSGELAERSRSVNDLAEDTIYIYYRTGGLKEKYAVKGGKKEGIYYEYYPNGSMQYSVNYKDNEADGEFTSYHLNGQKKETFNLKEGKIEGKRTSWYPNGQLKSEQEYKEGQYNGPYTTYFSNGKLEEKGSYKNAKQIGETVEYYTNGTMSFSATLDESGKMNGSSAYYDYDGKKYHDFQFNKGDLTSIAFVDKAGKSTELSGKKGKKLDYVFNYPNGNKKVIGEYLDGERNGTWEYYDVYGNIERKENYVKGLVNDTVTTFHSNGQVESKAYFVDGVQQGMFLKYNIFGNLVEEGFFKDDSYDKEWYFYFDDGSLHHENYYVDGQKNGIQKSYGVNGKLESWEEYDLGRVITHVFLDTNEQIVDQYGEYNGKIELHNPVNTFVNFTGEYKNGNADGTMNWYAPDKTLELTGKYVNSERTGTWKWYHTNGKIEEEITYVNGDADGKRLSYHDNGKIWKESTYLYGSLQGPYTIYHDNGKQQVSGTYLDDNRHGKISYFSPQGTLAIIRNYDQDNIVSYTYLDANGKEVPPVMLDKQDLKVVAYFKNGKKSNAHTRKNGLVEGVYLAYHDNGQKWEEENYLYGDAHGKSYQYNEAGQKIEEADYLYGRLHGKLLTFYANGKVKSEENYLFGQQHGKHIEYGPDGKITSVTIYYNNEIVSIQKF